MVVMVMVMVMMMTAMMMMMAMMFMIAMIMMSGGLTTSECDKKGGAKNINDSNNDFEDNCENVAGICLIEIKRPLTLKQQC